MGTPADSSAFNVLSDWEATMHMSDQQIRTLAYYLWEAEGCPEGWADSHWFKAKELLEIGENDKVTVISSSVSPRIRSGIGSIRRKNK
jgi:hypothetical protein